MSFGGKAPSAGALILLAIGVAVLLLGGEGDGGRPGGTGGIGAPAPDREHARVTRVIDGDTVEVQLDGREEDVRYIGVDTPESVIPGETPECFGPQASSFNERLVAGETVRLEFGPELRDRYGR